MPLKLILTKIQLYYLIGFLFATFTITVISCNNNTEKKAKTKTETDFKTEVDTLALIAKQIDAELKHQQLDTLYKNKAYLRGFNGNVLVAQQGVIIYQKCFGYCNYESKDSLNLDTKFQIASLSKTFTAVAILKLMEQGKLQLTDLLTDYFPALPFKKVTIAMLLSHRSGIANYVNVYSDKVIKGNLFPNNNELMDWLKSFDKKYISRPGKSFNYSNTNFVLLAAIIEKVSGLSYAQFLHENLFEPLQMSNSWVSTDSNAEAYLNRTTSYSAFWKKKQADNFDYVVGDKGIYSTVKDLYKWYDGLMNYKILKQETIDSAWTPRSKERKGVKNYGYGFRMLCYNDSDKVIYHNGWWNSYNSLFYINPKLKYVIIVLGNKYNSDIYDIHSAFKIMNEVKNSNEYKLD
ncbi:MAG: serine hydrolase [Bacteroidetes bacterium]|nr:serine hydrolase [Bacteroidota bacterium]